MVVFKLVAHRHPDYGLAVLHLDNATSQIA